MKKEKYIIVLHDRHIDDRMYLYYGTLSNVELEAKKLFLEMGRDIEEEESYDTFGFRYKVSALDGDYSAAVYNIENPNLIN